MAVRSALCLVIKGRGVYRENLKNHLYCMVKLFLLLRGKLHSIDDEEIQSLMLKEWDLIAFIEEFIQTLMPVKEFGGYRKNYQKEIEASIATYNIPYMWYYW